MFFGYSTKIVEELIRELKVEQIWEYRITRSARFDPEVGRT